MGRFYGVNGWAELPMVYSWDPRRGANITRPFKGTPAAVDTLVLAARAAGLRFERHNMPDGGYSLFSEFLGAEDTQPANVALSDYLDCEANDLEKSIWTLPWVVREMNKLYVVVANVIQTSPLAVLARIRADVEALARGEVVTNDPATGLPSPTPLTLDSLLAFITLHGPTINIEVFKKLIYLFSMGEDSYWASSWVLRRRTVIARNSSIKTSTANIDKVFWTTEELFTIEELPDNQPGLEVPDGQWLKKSPKRDQIEANKWQIVQEYWWADEWSIAYELASA